MFIKIEYKSKKKQKVEVVKMVVERDGEQERSAAHSGCICTSFSFWWRLDPQAFFKIKYHSKTQAVACYIGHTLVTHLAGIR